MRGTGTSTERRTPRVAGRPPAPADADHLGEVHDAVAVRLTKHGVRYTAHRRAIVAALGKAGQPLTIPEIVAAAPRLPQSSVYRNLAVFDDAGIVHRMAGAAGFARYELAEELMGHHHHLVCSTCGAVADVTLPPDAEADLERVLRGVARRHGFSLASHRLDLVGECNNCEDTTTEPPGP
ncbi:MAG TPA: Fur family transcriptional regulator [Candidatus Dormibacteraeota bacterium]|jgi:Fe2+ or Zn2+ uptake regulation protein|nr:Fur family transcriptional regulator [Candidatus Dormibacteraeota bacterium]